LVIMGLCLMTAISCSDSSETGLVPGTTLEALFISDV
jgi:hypothetical protein